jgi:hypothetical protein
MVKKFLIALSLLVVCAAVAAGVWIARDSRKAGTPLAAESAMPAVADGGEYLFVKLADTASLGSKIEAAGDMFAAIAENGDLPQLRDRNFDMTLIPEIIGVIDDVSGFMNGVKDMAMLVKSPDMTGHLAFIADDENFDKFISPEGIGRRAEKWDTALGDGWKIQVSAPMNPAATDICIVRKKTGADNLVMISSEEGAGEMAAAADDPSRRFTAFRRTDGRNFISMRLSMPVGVLSVQKPIFAETSWTTSENVTSIKTYTDAYEAFKSKIGGSGLKNSDFPLLGNGDLMAFAMLDIPFICFSAFPNADDPVQTFLDMALERSRGGEEAAGAFMGDIKALMSKGRISMAAMTAVDNGKPGQLCFFLESGDGAAINKLFSMATLAFNKPEQIEGWDSAYSMSMGPNLSLMFARKGDTIMIGTGGASDFANAARLPEEANGIVGADNLSSVFVSSKILDAYEAFNGESVQEALRKAGMPESLWELSGLSELEAIRLRQSELGKSEIDVYWKPAVR